MIVAFQLQLKILSHVISQKTFKQVFHSNEHKCVEKIISFKILQELCWRPLCQNPLYMVIKTLDEMKEKFPPKFTKIYPKKCKFLPKVAPPSVLSPNPIKITSSLGPFKYCSCKPCVPCKYLKILLDII